LLEGSRLTNIPVPAHSLKSKAHSNSVSSVSDGVVSAAAAAVSFSSQGLKWQFLSGSRPTKIPVFLHSLKSDGQCDSITMFSVE
jgi:hypothetical protein